MVLGHSVYSIYLFNKKRLEWFPSGFVEEECYIGRRVMRSFIFLVNLLIRSVKDRLRRVT